MGIAAFEWGNRKLTLLHNRNNFDNWVINPAAWDGSILSGRVEPNGGTWCGISRNGRVAFLVDQMLFDPVNNCMSLPSEFLQGEMIPLDFANEMAGNPTRYNGMTFKLIVADITSNSMYYISKTIPHIPRVQTEEVGSGVHILSLGGLDIEHPNDSRLRDFFGKMIDEYKDKELPSLREIAGKFMYDPNKAVEGDQLSAIFLDFTLGGERRYKTTCTTALVVKPTKEVDFYERYLENDEWKDHDFSFNIA